MPSDRFLGKQVRKQAFEFTRTSVLEIEQLLELPLRLYSLLSIKISEFVNDCHYSCMLCSCSLIFAVNYLICGF